ncbi:hypothetical protein PR202_gb02388 [Eleusine coracana subsp. coracana]|uniref:DUF1618 domain-containing protein n=1 Tax=Eleusine coracana subsp. coracana TaxID=191504 RepID=A0AAV5DZ81_ELECO|nr:hypothetical protein PR202_gb02388 [Eleusine coracana subsp. coracana]
MDPLTRREEIHGRYLNPHGHPVKEAIGSEGDPSMEEDWVMLERFVFRRDGGGDKKPLPENETTAASSTSIGFPFRVSLGLVSLPSISRFYLEWPGGPKEEIGNPCHLVAAHRDCVLFRLTSIVRSKTRPQYLIYPDDYYIYRPAAGDLKRLPTCIIPVAAAEKREQKHHDKLDPISSESSESGDDEIVVTEEMKWSAKKAREEYEEMLAMGVDVDQEVVPSSLVMGRIGLVCLESLMSSQGGGDEFVVAELRLNKLNHRKAVSAELSLFRSSACDWVHIMPLPIHCSNKHDSSSLRHFSIQAVVPFGDCGLCWVDYHGGIIIAKNLLEQTPSLSYIPLPRAPLASGQQEHKLRSVCATAGHGCSLKFIDVVVEEKPFGGGFTFTITSYKLIIATQDGTMKWEKETSMTSDEMWSLKAPGRAPHVVPKFPLVCQDKPHIIHFQLSECTDYIDTVTLVAIDMSARVVVSVFTHIKGEQELRGEDADVAGERTGHWTKPNGISRQMLKVQNK